METARGSCNDSCPKHQAMQSKDRTHRTLRNSAYTNQAPNIPLLCLHLRILFDVDVVIGFQGADRVGRILDSIIPLASGNA